MSANETYGLVRIICLDAHIQGKRMEIKVGRHANLSGTNGAGKTTLLKLLPFFYGAEPNQVVQTVGKRKRFVDYYLPRPTSLIIFEYRTPRGLACAVVYRHSTGEKPAYRFLDEGFSVEYFSELRDGKHVFAEGRALGKLWSFRQLDHSKQLESVLDYRAIIQGDRTLINRSGDSHELVTLVNRYCISGRMGTMRYLDKMAVAILGRVGDMGRIKEMLADIMNEDGVVLPSIKLKKDVRNMLDEVAILRDLDRQRDKLTAVVNEGNHYLEISAQLDALHSEVSFCLASIVESLDAVDEQLKTINGKKASTKSDWEERELKLTGDVAEWNGAKEQAEVQLDALLAEKGDWEKQEIERQVTEYQQLENFRQLLQSAKERLRVLEDDVQDLRRSFDERRYQEKDRHTEAIQKLDERLGELKEALSEVRNALLEEKLVIERAANQEKELLRAERQPEIDGLTEDIALARQKAEQVMALESEKLAEAEAELSRERAAEKYSQALDSVEESRLELKSKTDKQRGQEEEERRASRRLKKQQDEHRELVALCNPKPGSLLSALREQEPNWHDHLGRLLRPELLERKDLSPEFHAEATDKSLLMGWHLDIERIAKPEWASSRQVLEQRLQTEEDELDRAEREHERQKSLLDDAAKALQQAELELVVSQQVLGKADLSQTSAIEALRQVREDNQQAAEARKQAAKAEAEKLLQQRKQLRDELERDLLGVYDRSRQALDDAMATAATEQSRLEELIEEHEKAISTENDTHQNQLKVLESDFRALCSEQGLDDKVIDEANLACKRANQTVERVQGYQHAVADYQQWLSRSWSQKDDFRQRLSSCSKTWEECRQILSRERREYRRLRDGLVKEHDKQQQRRRELSANQEDCRQLLFRLSKPVSPVETKTARTLALILSDGNNLLEAKRGLMEQIRAGTANAEKIICSGGENNQIAEAWAALRREALDLLANPNDQDGLALNLTRALEQFMSVQLPQKRETLSAFVDNTGAQLDDFYIKLDQVSEAISRQSRQISGAIGDHIHFEAITDIEVGLKSRIDTQDYWPALKAFHDDWLQWKTEEGRDLPPAAITKKLLDAADILHKSRGAQGIESVFDLEISLRENGRPLKATTRADLENASSTGLSYLILCTIFAGISRMLCREPNVAVHWPMDELGTLAPENISRLFMLLDEHNIVMVGGFPSTDQHLLQHFKEHHQVKKGEGIVELVLPEDKLSGLIARRRKQQSQMTEEVGS